MSLRSFFEELARKVEASEVVSNLGRDEQGFFKPKKTVVLRHLNLLRDLHEKPRARPMLKASWEAVVAELPPEWLIIASDNDRRRWREILGEEE